MTQKFSAFSSLKKTIVSSVAILIFSLSSSVILAGQTAPNLTLKKLDNSSFKIGDLKGEVVYVDFWATWCPPCRKSFPWMESMQQRYKDLGFQVVAISLDNKREVIDQFLKTMDTSFTIAHDPSGDSATAFKVKGMPSSYLIDRHGNIHKSHMGFNDRDKAGLESAIKNLLAQD